jgi:hypothetical protein
MKATSSSLISAPRPIDITNRFGLARNSRRRLVLEIPAPTCGPVLIKCAEYISGGLSELNCSSVAVLQRAPQMPEHAYPGLKETGYLHCSVGIGMRLSQSKEICVDPVCGH